MSNYWQKAALDWSDDSVLYFLSPSFRALSNYFYIQEAGHFRTKPTYYTERQNLLSYLVLYTYEGSGVLKYKGKEYELKEGDLFFIDCSKYQYYAPIEKKTWCFYFIHFFGSSSDGYFNEFFQDGNPCCFVKNTGLPKMMKTVVKFQSKLSITTEIWNSKFLTDILTELLIIKKNPENLFIPDLIMNIQAFLEKYFSHEHTLESLSKEFNISKSYLNKEFNRYIGISPIEFLIQTRINNSKNLLRNSSLSIAEISEKVGINNQTHFINLFKNRTGQTPGKYRKAWNKQN